MATEHIPLEDAYEEKQHQAAYIFDPSGDADDRSRPAKRRRVSTKSGKSQTGKTASVPALQRLFDGSEHEDCARLRQQLFEHSWSEIDSRIQRILREANQSTLDEVTSFLKAAPDHVPTSKIPSAFIITGANIASQDLLFEQLSEALQSRADAKVVRLRSGDASNLKAVLKKIIQAVLVREDDDENDLDLAVGKDGRKYLNYDLEALHAHLKSSPRRHITIAFQDSEAFESGLLSDIIPLFSSWRDRIPFSLLFGVATSVELFQARLLKSTCQCLYGDQFDVEQSASIVDKIFKTAIAHSEAPLRLGPSLISSLLERQRDQTAGIPVFVNSLKYAYMCHFYANPLSVMLSGDMVAKMCQQEHIEAVRCLPSFRRSVEAAVGDGNTQEAKLLLDDDKHLVSHLQVCLAKSRQWIVDLLRASKILTTDKPVPSTFTRTYLDAVSNGVDLAGHNAEFRESIKRLQPSDSVSFLTRVLEAIEDGDPSLGLGECGDESEETVTALSGILADVKRLQGEAEEQGNVLRSQYGGQSRIVRTTVVAQKVQLSRDTAALTDQDKEYTDLMDRLVETLEVIVRVDSAEDLPFNEIWLYDSKTPYRDVFIPRPRVVVERALSRPHDYLGCACCKADENQIMPSLPPTAILYRMYLETGSLINVADLWSAYYALVGEDNEDEMDERTALVLFYRALAELRAVGFVKQSRKKADHIAKLAWKGL